MNPILYNLISSSFSGNVVLGYDPATKALIRYENQSQMTQQQQAYFLQHLPAYEIELIHLMGKSHSLEARRLEADLSFASIWEAYSYKMGRKEAEKAWASLGEAEKQAVFDCLPAYNYYLMCRPNMDRAYLGSFIQKRRWEDDFRGAKKAP